MEKTKTNRRRIRYTEIAPEGTGFLGGLEKYIVGTTLEPLLVELVKIRASQINGCAFCLDMHTKDARDQGESEQRLYAVSTWREAPYYSARERAAIEWSEVITKISEYQNLDEIYDRVKAHFTDKEMVDLTLAIDAINSWNRLAIVFKSPAGSYLPDHPVTKRKSGTK